MLRYFIRIEATNLPFVLQFDNLSDLEVRQIRTKFIGKHFCPCVIRTVRATYSRIHMVILINIGYYNY